jgi:hypothetical protein
MLTMEAVWWYERLTWRLSHSALAISTPEPSLGNYTNHTDSIPAFNTKRSIVSQQNCPGFTVWLTR